MPLTKTETDAESEQRFTLVDDLATQYAERSGLDDDSVSSADVAAFLIADLLKVAGDNGLDEESILADALKRRRKV